MNRPRHLKRTLLAAAAGLMALAAIGAVLVYQGVIWPNRWFAAGYEVRGVDVSTYQGDVTWTVLAGQDLDFAYVKATEGSGHTDSQFAANWAGATAAGLAVGAYHFFSFDSSAQAQAANIIATVPRTPGMLPIAIDVEYYGPHAAAPPDAATVDALLGSLVRQLTEHYGAPPVLYATADTYDRYLAGKYPDNPIWIRSIIVPPHLSDGRSWTLWQYSNRERLDGYAGEERFIDMNAFHGSRADLDALRLPG